MGSGSGLGDGFPADALAGSVSEEAEERVALIAIQRVDCVVEPLLRVDCGV